MPTTNINGINLYYETYGQGEPLVLICGLSGDLQYWQTVLNQLCQHYQVILFDNRGAGRTDAPDEPYSIKLMAEDLSALLMHLKITKAHILGHSMGGFIAQQFAYQFPQQTNKLIIYASAPEAGHINTHIFRTNCQLKANPLTEDIFIKIGLYLSLSEKFFANPNNVEAVVRLGKNNPYAQTVQGYRQQVEALAAFNSTAWLEKIAAPTLIIACEADRIFLVDRAEYLNEQIPDSELALVPNAAHAFHLEDPQTFVDHVLGFLQE